MNPRIRVAAVIVRDGSLLLVRHVKDGQSYWLLPGGGVEQGEALDAALEREVREETNLEIVVGDIAFVVDSIEPGGRHIVNICFLAEAHSGDLKVMADERVVEARFVPFEEIDSLRLYPDLRRELLEGIENRFARTLPYLGARWS